VTVKLFLSFFLARCHLHKDKGPSWSVAQDCARFGDWV
jgi:hypothetical protein